MSTAGPQAALGGHTWLEQAQKDRLSDYSVDVNGEGSVGKESSCYLTGEAQRNTRDMLLNRRVTVCTYP